MNESIQAVWKVITSVLISLVLLFGLNGVAHLLNLPSTDTSSALLLCWLLTVAVTAALAISFNSIWLTGRTRTVATALSVKVVGLFALVYGILLLSDTANAETALSLWIATAIGCAVGIAVGLIAPRYLLRTGDEI